jgi:hypothetical protein
MGRLSICLLCALTVSLSGCGTPGPITTNETVERSDFWGKTAPAGPSTASQWLDDNPGVMYAAVALVAVAGVVAVTVFAIPSLFGHFF